MNESFFFFALSKIDILVTCFTYYVTEFLLVKLNDFKDEYVYTHAV